MFSAALLGLALATAAPSTPGNEPAEPVRIADNLYYVGASDIASYLITTPAGHILIDAGYEDTVPIIRRNVEKLGFKMTDVKILLNTQAHFDHAAGFAELKKLIGARLAASDADAALLERGGHGDYLFRDRYTFPPVHVDQRVKDGERVNVGGMTLAAHLTPGHTPGCTTWTFDVKDRGRTYHVVVVGGATINPGTRVSGMPTYPGISRDYESTFEVLASLPCDIFLGAHRGYYNGGDKMSRLVADPNGANPLVDPEGYRAAVARWHSAFEKQLAAEKNSVPSCLRGYD